jgi:hypothetical protein
LTVPRLRTMAGCCGPCPRLAGRGEARGAGRRVRRLQTGRPITLSVDDLWVIFFSLRLLSRRCSGLGWLRRCWRLLTEEVVEPVAIVQVRGTGLLGRRFSIIIGRRWSRGVVDGARGRSWREILDVQGCAELERLGSNGGHSRTFIHQLLRPKTRRVEGFQLLPQVLQRPVLRYGVLLRVSVA